jgi:hypothetical protein
MCPESGWGSLLILSLPSCVTFGFSSHGNTLACRVLSVCEACAQHLAVLHFILSPCQNCEVYSYSCFTDVKTESLRLRNLVKVLSNGAKIGTQWAKLQVQALTVTQAADQTLLFGAFKGSMCCVLGTNRRWRAKK